MASELEACLAESGTLAFRVASRLLRHREDAEDVSQEAVVRALQRFDSLRDPSRFQAWLVRVAWRLAMDRRRSDWRRTGRDVHLVSTGIADADAERDLIARERAERVRAAIDQLPARLRTPLVLGHVDERSVDEVATLLQLPAGTVKSRTFQARKRLKQDLVKAGIALGIVATSILSIQRLQVVDRRSGPASASPALSIATAAPTPAAAAAPVRTHAAPRVTAVAAAAEADAPVDQSDATITVPTIDVSVVVIPVVKVPAVQVRTIERTPISVPSVSMEKQR